MKLWDGRFEKDTDPSADAFQASIGFDRRLYQEDIQGSLAHAAMLVKQGILSPTDGEAIATGLTDILADFESGNITIPPGCEDIHMLVEQELTRRIGDAGKRLHTARSRNDQVALDMRLYTMRACEETQAAIHDLCATLLDLAEKHAGDIMPGYTHMQRAQPITLGHWLMAYFEMFLRDIGRVQAAKAAADSMPLGSGALAGTVFAIDRTAVMETLGFSNLSRNSLDAVSDRDFVLNYLYAAAAGMSHLSRLCGELVMWNTAEFAFVTMDDAYATGSSMMPQKKNPDLAELVRGKTGRAYGSLITLLTVMKGLPLAYNKDMQEDKEAFFDAQDTYIGCLTMTEAMLRTLTFHTDVMHNGALDGFTNATDCADYLVRKGVPFRSAHEITGKLVAYCMGKGCAIGSLSQEEFAQFSAAFSADIYEAISLDTCVKARQSTGGTAPDNVLAEVQLGRERLAAAIGA
jgi:argininosuccinate lyase